MHSIHPPATLIAFYTTINVIQLTRSVARTNLVLSDVRAHDHSQKANVQDYPTQSNAVTLVIHSVQNGTLYHDRY